jgi:hypothetical protein
MPLRSSLTTSRRQTLGLALLSMAGLPRAATTEGKNRKNRKNRKKKDTCDRKVEQGIAETCGSQLDICITSVAVTCERSRDPEACLAQVSECCGYMGRCELQEYLTCISSLFGASDPP